MSRIFRRIFSRIFSSGAFFPPPAFGNDNPQVKEKLSYFERSPMVKHSVLGFFAKYIIEYKDLIEKDLEIHGTAAGD